MRSVIAILIPIVVLTIIAVLLIVVLGVALLTTFGTGEYVEYADTKISDRMAYAIEHRP